jgi:hypothetical protein
VEDQNRSRKKVARGELRLKIEDLKTTYTGNHLVAMRNRPLD